MNPETDCSPSKPFNDMKFDLFMDHPPKKKSKQTLFNQTNTLYDGTGFYWRKSNPTTSFIFDSHHGTQMANCIPK